MNQSLESALDDIADKIPPQIKLMYLPKKGIFNSLNKVEVRINDIRINFTSEYKAEPRLMHLPHFETINKEMGPLIVIARHISNTVKEKLRACKISYAELSGNIFIDNQQFFVFIDGKKNTAPKIEMQNRAFTKTGLKVVFAFLQEPQLINFTYREIAKQTGVTINTVHNVINGLKKLKYIVQVKDKQLELVNSRSLLLRWVQEYDIRLKPTLFLGSFSFAQTDDFDNWKQKDLKSPATQWGGEPGGDLLTAFLRPGLLTVYTEKKKAEVMQNLKLLPHPLGKIKIYQKFWKTPEASGIHVPEILIYTDLLNSGDSRNAEIAKKIDEQYLQGRFS